MKVIVILGLLLVIGGIFGIIFGIIIRNKKREKFRGRGYWNRGWGRGYNRYWRNYPIIYNTVWDYPNYPENDCCIWTQKGCEWKDTDGSIHYGSLEDCRKNKK